MPAPALTGYALTNYFRKLRLREIISPLQAYLFYELVAICNDEGWPAEFSATNGTLQVALGCTEEGLNQARKRLKQVGLIDFVSGTRRTPTRYCFAVNGLTQLSHLPANGPTKGLTEDSAELDHSDPEQANGPTEGPTKGSGELDPYKEQTKTKRRDSSKLKNEAAQIGESFEQFWEAYGKKVGRHKSVERWKTLTADEQAAALAHATLFAAATPDKQFRKDPLTYLNGKCWLDEELPAPRHGQQPAPVPVPAPPPLPPPDLNEEFLAEQAARAATEEDAHFARYAAAA